VFWLDPDWDHLVSRKPRGDQCEAQEASHGLVWLARSPDVAPAIHPTRARTAKNKIEGPTRQPIPVWKVAVSAP
jgi:hypothetical protein